MKKKRESILFVLDIIESIENIQNYTKGITKEIKKVYDELGGQEKLIK